MGFIQSQQNAAKTTWMGIVSKYTRPVLIKSWWQLINSLIPFIILWIAMVYSLQISYWLTLLLSFFAAGFMVRVFIIFHDCGHGSFFKSHKLNLWVGIVTGFICLTPYHKWHRDHKIHHATVGNLDQRGIGDVRTLTVDEYLNSSRLDKFLYRLYRNPLFLFGIAPFFLFVFLHRFTKKYMNFRERLYVYLTNLTLAAVIFLIIQVIGWKHFLMIQLPITYIGTIAGLWLFYVQHQFENVIWTNKGEWDYKKLALEGSSYYKLPRVLQWFTGNIGFHHIHHLSPRIPNYNLEKCHNENEEFQVAKQFTLWTGLHALRLRLWNEKLNKMISFSELNRQRT
jgi:acyl-lipid omega-6 desaturase (Delta-12 desaturase)